MSAKDEYIQLNKAVTTAIFLVVNLERQRKRQRKRGGKRQGQLDQERLENVRRANYLHSYIEENLARLLAPESDEGTLARKSSILAAKASGDIERARDLLALYLKETPNAAGIQEAFDSP